MVKCCRGRWVREKEKYNVLGFRGIFLREGENGRRRGDGGLDGSRRGDGGLGREF